MRRGASSEEVRLFGGCDESCDSSGSGFIAAVSGTNSEAKHFPGIFLVPFLLALLR